jgi:hypothetical protein
MFKLNSDHQNIHCLENGHFNDTCTYNSLDNLLQNTALIDVSINKGNYRTPNNLTKGKSKLISI